jgi:hypothetical protein
MIIKAELLPLVPYNPINLQQLHNKAQRLNSRLAPSWRDPEERVKRLQNRLEQDWFEVELHKQAKKRAKLELSAKRKEERRLEVRRRQQEVSDAEFKRQRKEHWEQIFQQAEARPSLWNEVLKLSISTPFYGEALARSKGRLFTDLIFLLEKDRTGRKLW